jgi:hypothetical protein
MTPPIAHAGHWFVSVLYVLPLLAALGFLGLQAVRDRRREHAESAKGRPPDA